MAKPNRKRYTTILPFHYEPYQVIYEESTPAEFTVKSDLTVTNSWLPYQRTDWKQARQEFLDQLEVEEHSSEVSQHISDTSEVPSLSPERSFEQVLPSNNAFPKKVISGEDSPPRSNRKFDSPRSCGTSPSRTKILDLTDDSKQFPLETPPRISSLRKTGSKRNRRRKPVNYEEAEGIELSQNNELTNIPESEESSSLSPYRLRHVYRNLTDQGFHTLSDNDQHFDHIRCDTNSEPPPVGIARHRTNHSPTPTHSRTSWRSRERMRSASQLGNRNDLPEIQEKQLDEIFQSLKLQQKTRQRSLSRMSSRSHTPSITHIDDRGRMSARLRGRFLEDHAISRSQSVASRDRTKSVASEDKGLILTFRSKLKWPLRKTRSDQQIYEEEDDDDDAVPPAIRDTRF